MGDEFTPARSLFDRRPDGSVVVDGRAPIADLRDALSLDLADVSADTAAGFVVEKLGRMAEPGDVIRADGASFEVLEIEGHRIERVLVRRPG